MDTTDGAGSSTTQEKAEDGSGPETKVEPEKPPAETAAVDVEVEGYPSAQEIIDVDTTDPASLPVPAPAPLPSMLLKEPIPWEKRFEYDLEFEASKVPLEVAIINSCAAGTGGNDRVKKYLGQGVLVVGGGSMIKGMSQSLQSRLSALCLEFITGMPPVQIQPPPKDVDPRVLIWKGASVLGKMDGVADLWITRDDWVG